MKKLTNKKKIIIISAVAVVLVGAIPVSVKNIQSYVEYVDSFGSDTMQEAVELAVSANYFREILIAECPRKTIENEYGRKWWKDEKFLKDEEEYNSPGQKVGWKKEYCDIEIASAKKITSMSFFEDDLEYEEIYDAGLKIEEGFVLGVDYCSRTRYDYDVNGEDVATAGSGELIYEPVGEWLEWKDYYNQTYVAYKIAGKWYCRYWGE